MPFVSCKRESIGHARLGMVVGRNFRFFAPVLELLTEGNVIMREVKEADTYVRLFTKDRMWIEAGVKFYVEYGVDGKITVVGAQAVGNREDPADDARWVQGEMKDGKVVLTLDMPREDVMAADEVARFNAIFESPNGVNMTMDVAPVEGDEEVGVQLNPFGAFITFSD
ncbi:MAG: hypothetical protein B7X02_00135 [Rhodospirillales bacterium 12-54-5]|nr:MAG: hypothetical protein B7X02_00135 [Rhodospirillales bacterium 12-54-5]